MVDPALVAGGVELTKLAIQLALATARQYGLTEEQLDRLISDEREKFKQRPASELPDV